MQDVPSKPDCQSSHPVVKTGKTGVVLVNLGTPEATNFLSIRRYLKEFLSDPRVVEVPRILWKIILNVFILTFRPSKTARLYKAIWRQETDESPLRYYARRQAEKLADLYQRQPPKAEHPKIIVDWAMRYGKPSIEKVLHRLQGEGCRHIVIVPLYPQYSATTTASVTDEVYRCLSTYRWQPCIRITNTYHDHPQYIKALRSSIISHLETLDWTPERILVSYHGIPKDYAEKGDPYGCFCHKTTRLLREAMPKGTPPLEISFQSRFGPREWLRPYTDETLMKWAKEGLQKVAVITPGFASDCIETLEEIDLQGREIFLENGGTHFTFIPCLNDRDESIQLIQSLINETAGAWNL